MCAFLSSARAVKGLISVSAVFHSGVKQTSLISASPVAQGYEVILPAVDFQHSLTGSNWLGQDSDSYKRDLTAVTERLWVVVPCLARTFPRTDYREIV